MSNVVVYALLIFLGFLGGITLTNRANCKLKIEGAEIEHELIRVMDTLDDINDELEMELKHQYECGKSINDSLNRCIVRTSCRLKDKSKVLRKIVYPKSYIPHI